MNLIYLFLQALNEMFGGVWCTEIKKVFTFLGSCILQVATLWNYVSSISQLCHAAFCVLHVSKMQNPLASGNVTGAMVTAAVATGKRRRLSCGQVANY